MMWLLLINQITTINILSLLGQEMGLIYYLLTSKEQFENVIGGNNGNDF